jgi:hypothetical protein
MALQSFWLWLEVDSLKGLNRESLDLGGDACISPASCVLYARTNTDSFSLGDLFVGTLDLSLENDTSAPLLTDPTAIVLCII